ncbi:MAG: VanW family protein [Lachnospiraceae bacterium]|nr:VanW family protein [Lachnospiraceae bacterium]
MKRCIKGIVCLLAVLVLSGTAELRTQAQEEDRILSGIYVEDISLEGKTAGEAKEAVEEYIEELQTKVITLVAINGNEVQVTPQDLGFAWSNPEIIEEAVAIGQKGNIVQRYKAAKDLQMQNKVFDLEFEVDKQLVNNILTTRCSAYNQEAMDATLVLDDGGFLIHPGQVGKVVDEAASTELICSFIQESWDGQDASVDLAIIEDQPRGTEEELSKVKDVLGTYTTSFRTSNKSRSANVRNGCALISGITLYPGDEFSTYEMVSPFSEENGYYMAGSYLNGQVVDSLGGGICQVSTTLYNAVLLAELEVTERHNHSMIVTYVDPSADAAIAESSGKDFKFVNNTDAPIYIDGYTTDDKQICFTIYGMETRDPGREVRYESEIVSTTHPDSEVIYTNDALPVGSIDVQSAHIGYKANLWKVVTEDGVEVSREQVNSSSYKMVPRYATVGVATEDPNVYNVLMAAVATNNIDHVKAVVAALTSGTEVPPSPVVEQPADPAAQPVDPAAAQPAG